MRVKEVLGPRGLSRVCDKSYPWAVAAFAKRLVPTEYLIDGRRPGVTYETLKPLLPELRKYGSGRRRAN